eukprot:1136147-Pelagomonas_calceolata.AAC.3
MSRKAQFNQKSDNKAYLLLCGALRVVPKGITGFLVSNIRGWTYICLCQFAVKRSRLHESLPACVIAIGYVGRAKLVFVMHVGFELIIKVSEVERHDCMGVPSGGGGDRKPKGVVDRGFGIRQRDICGVQRHGTLQRTSVANRVRQPYQLNAPATFALFEIKYCEDTRPGQQLEAAQRQHADLSKNISGKAVTLHTILLGVGGTC